jgi:hypothetical protein
MADSKICSPLLEFLRKTFAPTLKIDCSECNFIDVLAMLHQGETDKVMTCTKTTGKETTNALSQLLGLPNNLPLYWLLTTCAMILVFFNG